MINTAEKEQTNMFQFFCAPSIYRKFVNAAFLLLALGALLSGCSTPNVCSYQADTPIFFPPAPDEPHIQYLTGINSSDNIGAAKKQSGVSLFLSGKEAPDIIKKIGKAYGIVAHKGKLYVAEGMNGRIDIIDPVHGTFESPVGLNIPKGALKYPVNLTVDPDDFLYVADTARREIVVYDAAGNYFAAFPNNYAPKSKIVDVKYYNGKLFALDLGTSMIRVLDPKTGAQITTLGYIEKPDQSVRLPDNLAIDSTGNLYVANIGNNRVIKYDQDGNYLGTFGGSGDTVGTFAKPKGVAVSPEGYIFVVDGGTNVVQLFDDKFHPLTYFGWPGLAKGSLNGPAGITLSTDKGNVEYFQKYAAPGFKVDYLVFVVSQFGQEFCIPRISVYGVGQMQKK
jgi:streptogramin lyase